MRGVLTLLASVLASSCGSGGDRLRDGARGADDTAHAGGLTVEPRGTAAAPSRIESVDLGDVCLSETLTAGQPLAVNVHPQGRCMSSSCTRWIENTCSVARRGSSIVVHSRQVFEEAPPDHSCTEDCGGAAGSTCTTSEPLLAGRYTLEFGKTEVGFDVPTRFSSSCVGGGATLTPAKP